MRQRTRFFLVVLLLMFAGNIFSQNRSSDISHIYVKKDIRISDKDGTLLLNLYKPKIKKTIIVSQSIGNHCWDCLETTVRVFNLLTPIAKDFSTTQLGIVCRKEFEFEKKTSIPLRLRIGSLDYTDYMERKPNALKPL